ncbi:MAG: Flp pilus assembly complex ATPase component TadA, partial [Lachnospiraceae bacterium]|nr:Flp pilus assembly complex ATPase component TadA [Lachnospiraceae bacterium]
MAETAFQNQKMDEIIREARKMGASDIHISEGMPTRYRVHGRLVQAQTQYSAKETAELLRAMMTEKQAQHFAQGNDADFAIRTSDGCRQRVNVFRQQKRIAATIRLLNSKIPTLEELHMPTVLYKMAEEPRGLILVTGPTGSGKSTTLAAMLEYMNRNSDRHIITIEDPIEYVYESKQSLIHQREVGED